MENTSLSLGHRFGRAEVGRRGTREPLDDVDPAGSELGTCPVGDDPIALDVGEQRLDGGALIPPRARPTRPVERRHEGFLLADLDNHVDHRHLVDLIDRPIDRPIERRIGRRCWLGSDARYGRGRIERTQCARATGAAVEFDLMSGASTWSESARLATELERVGFSGMLYTETSQVPWMQIAAAATAAPTLMFATGIAVAFPRSPMVSAATAWELAHNTEGRFRLGLGSQVKAHIKRRYGAEFGPPGPRLRDYVLAVKACFRAFHGDEKLSHEGPYYRLNLLPPQWAPPRHDFGDIKVDISAVGPYMTRMAGEVADGVHVHPFHSTQYIRQRLLPAVAAGAESAGRDMADVDLVVPVFAIPGDSHEERASLVQAAKTQYRVLRLHPELRLSVRRPRIRRDDGTPR